MAEETMNKGTNDGGCGLFNFMGKKEEDTVNVEEKHSLTLMEALHHTHSNSSSSSDDEEVEEGSTGEKKKGLKEKIKEKMSGTDHGQQENELIPMAPNANATHEEDKKIGLIDKIKENFPGHHNKTGQQEPAAHTTLDEQGEPKDEKKGLLDKIKEKLLQEQ